jgi:hypothetical protein
VRLAKRRPAPERVGIRAFTFVPDRGAEVVLQGRLGAGVPAAPAFA